MIAVLVRKELRAQAPFFGFGLLLAAFDWLGLFLAEIPDQASPKAALGALVQSGAEGEVVMHFLVAFALGVGLLVREFEERTMEFLDALPSSRARLFAVKVAVAIGILMVLPLSDAALAILRAHLTRTSLSPDVRLDWILTGAGLEALQLLVFLALALVLSFFRSFAWVAMGLLFWAFVAATAIWPGTDLLDPFLLTRPVFHGQTWTPPIGQVLGQGALALGLFGLAFLVFLRAGDRILPRLSLPGDPRLHRFAGYVVVTLTTILVFSVFAWFGLKDTTPKPGTVTYADFGTARARTRYYDFLYPSNLEHRAGRLLAEADRIHDAVAAELGYDAAKSATIAVDALGSHAGTAGTTRDTKIRISLAAYDDLDELAAVLGHETTHVFIDELASERVRRGSWGGRFFHEGLAQYVEAELFRDDEARRRLAIIAAAFHQRHHLGLEDAGDDDLLTKKYDPDLVYALGASFVRTLVEDHGKDAPVRVLRALAREDAPGNLSGLEAWRDAFQAAGLDLEAAGASWAHALDAQAERAAAAIAELPRIVGRVEDFAGDDAFHGITFEASAPEGYRISCRFRLREDAPREDFVPAERRSKSACGLAKRRVRRGVFWYQLGYVDDRPGGSALWEPWVEVKLR